MATTTPTDTLTPTAIATVREFDDALDDAMLVGLTDVGIEAGAAEVEIVVLSVVKAAAEEEAVDCNSIAPSSQ
jgi:hypothetical protein